MKEKYKVRLYKLLKFFKIYQTSSFSQKLTQEKHMSKNLSNTMEVV